MPWRPSLSVGRSWAASAHQGLSVSDRPPLRGFPEGRGAGALSRRPSCVGSVGSIVSWAGGAFLFPISGPIHVANLVSRPPPSGPPPYIHYYLLACPLCLESTPRHRRGFTREVESRSSSRAILSDCGISDSSARASGPLGDSVMSGARASALIDWAVIFSNARANFRVKISAKISPESTHCFPLATSCVPCAPSVDGSSASKSSSRSALNKHVLPSLAFPKKITLNILMESWASRRRFPSRNAKPSFLFSWESVTCQRHK